MKLPFFITSRYIKSKNESKFFSLISVITVVGIALGVTVLIIAISILDGFEKSIGDNIIKFNSHINISSFGNRNLVNANLTKIKIENELSNQILSLSSYISKKVIISKKNLAEGVILNGIDSNFSKNSFNNIIKSGNYDLTDNSFSIIIGQKLAEKLSIKLNDKIVIFALNNDEPPSLSNLPIVEQFIVTGIYESGMAEYDDINAYINLNTANNFFEIKNEVSGFNINLFEISKIDSIKNHLTNFLGYPFYVRSFRDINKHIFTWLELQKQPIPIILGLIIIVAVFNIVGAILMLIIQKTEAIGVLKSMGAKSKQIVQIFLIQGIFLGLLGILIGNLLAFSLSKIQVDYKIISLPEQIYFLSSVPISIQIETYFFVSVIAFSICVIVSLIPSYIASKIQPITAIKFK